MRFMSLTSGSSGNCYYLETRESAVLIDAGIGGRTIRKRLKTEGVDVDNIKAVLVTHDHSDHIKGAGTLSEVFGKPIYSTKKVLANINNNYIINPKVSVASKHEIIKYERFFIGDMKITPFDVPHDASDNVGYKIESEGRVFAIITDVGRITDDISCMLSNVDHLVIEANYDDEMLEYGPYTLTLKDRIRGGYGHLSNRQCSEYLKNCGNENLKNVFLCHLSAHNNTEDLAYETVKPVLEQTKTKSGHGINLFVLPRGRSTRMFQLE